MKKEGNISRAVRGDGIGTLIANDQPADELAPV
jgi:hypothetical protein